MSLLLAVLRQPERLATLTLNEWDALIRLARHARMLGTLHALAEANAALDRIPAAPREWLIADRVRSNHVHKVARNELVEILRVLPTAIHAPLVLLKGAAYVGAGLPPAAGRRLSDLDLLLPRVQLEPVEAALRTAGWVSEATNDYDDYYYRVLSHELPPLTHPARGLEVDLHHTLTSPVSRLKVDGGQLLAQAVPLVHAPWPFSHCHVLAPTDMVLHSATHLLFNDELRGGLRDVYDMHRLCLHFAAADPGFWAALTARAAELGLERPLWYALTTLRRLLATPVPEHCMAALRGTAPNPTLDTLMASLIDRLLAPADPERLSAPVTEWLLFVRSHWVRMPAGILAPHLARKWARGARQTLRARLLPHQH